MVIISSGPKQLLYADCCVSFYLIKPERVQRLKDCFITQLSGILDSDWSTVSDYFLHKCTSFMSCINHSMLSSHIIKCQLRLFMFSLIFRLTSTDITSTIFLSFHCSWFFPNIVWATRWVLHNGRCFISDGFAYSVQG